ncbi:MAG: HD domain-containing phosphohydrolase [Burkholderiaceae bacterium]
MATPDSSAPQPAGLLLVDDDQFILNSLKRVLRKKGHRIHTALDPQEALSIMDKESINLVISDSQMPGMDGASLLAKIQKGWPDVVRILLTGYVDINVAIKAINNGRIHRYLSKPWEDDELCMLIDQSLERQSLQRERDRLQQLTQEQNRALQEANATLEARVRERTAELAHTAELLAQAHTGLQRAYVTATEVFSSLISQRLPRSRQTNKEVISLVVTFAKSKNLPQKLIDDLAMAAALYNVGKLTWEDALIALPPETMVREQRDRYRQYPTTGEQLLMALEPMQDAAAMIRHHQERWDGTGFPDGLAGMSIPLGSRILKLVVDYVEMQMGMVLARKIPPEDILRNMPKYAGRMYDPLLCREFVALATRMLDETEDADPTIQELQIHSLEPGMIMAKDLHSESGMLLLKQGTVLTERLVDRLRDFEENEAVRYTYYVQTPEDEAEE